MKNISFDNPYLLLVAIPLILLTVVPFIFAVRKGHRTKGVMASFIIHLFVVIIASLAVAGTYHTTVITETEVIVVADVSYSSNRNLDKIDSYINELEEKVPENSKIGIVCFAKEPVLLTAPGEEIRSVKEALEGENRLDDSSTDISTALDFAHLQFGEHTIKRIVLITDGKQTVMDADASLSRAIGNLYADDVYIDAVYVDNNLSPDTKEIQLSEVTFTDSSYLNHEEKAEVVIRSSYDTTVQLDVIRLDEEGETYKETHSFDLTEGFNVFSVGLYTEEAGAYDYELAVKAGSADGDYSEHNNSYFFSQSVAEHLNVLLITGNSDDEEKARELYGDGAEIDAYVNKTRVPDTVEDLMKYDEIVLSDFDVRELTNFISFIDSVDTVVSDYGKSLVTVGDTKIQNKTDDILKQLEDMLPVKFGNDDRDPKLYTFVIDISYSIFTADRFTMAKQSVIKIMDELLQDDDWVSIITFYGTAEIPQQPTRLGDKREELKKMVEKLEPKQGTLLGNGLRTAANMLNSQASVYSERQVFLITDGLAYEGYVSDAENPESILKSFRASGIYTSIINTMSPQGATYLKTLAKAADGEGKRNYFYIEGESGIDDLVLGEIADEVTETVIVKDTPIDIKLPYNEVLDGIDKLPNIQGYVYSKPKASADVVLSVAYEKASGVKLTSPLYATWNYGNGRVSSYTGSLTGEWVEGWQDNEGEQFLKNILVANTPERRIDYPYTVDTQFYGKYADLTISPAVINADAEVTVKITSPDGIVTDAVIPFNTNKYNYRFDSGETGKYVVEISYKYGNKEHSSTNIFHVSYSPEYDAFATFMPDKLAYNLGDRGTLSIDEIPELVNDEKDVTTYVVYFTVPFMIAAILLYVADIILRKLRWNDVKSLFKGKKKGKENLNK